MTAALGALHQVIPVLAPRDAIGNHAMELRALLRHHGLASEIYASVAVGERAGDARPLDSFTGGPGTGLIYQCSTGAQAGTWAASRREALVLDYHNITPSSFFEGWEPHVAVELRAGRSQLGLLAPRAVLGLADSAFNAAELDSAGCRASSVAPILLDVDGFDDEPDPATLEGLLRAKSDGGRDWLFVGRLAPHKAQHRLIAALALHRAVTGSPDRLHLVGGSSSARYERAMRQTVDELGLAGAVHFTASIGHGALVAHYRAADVFVSASEHEGFCVPLLEAMHAGLPVVAHAAAAVPETSGGAALLVSSASAAHLSCAVTRVLDDAALRAQLVARGRRRIEDFSLARTRARMWEALGPVVGQ